MSVSSSFCVGEPFEYSMPGQDFTDDPLAGYQPPVPENCSHDEAISVNSDFSPLSIDEVKRLERKRLRIMIPALFFAIAPTFMGLGLSANYSAAFAGFVNGMFGDTLLGSVLALSPFAVVVVATILPLIWAEKRAKPFAFLCPACSQDLTVGQNTVLLTRRCSRCDQQIIRGRKTYSDKVYKRFIRIRSQRYALRFLWVFPGLSIAALLGSWVSPASAERLGPLIIALALAGALGAGWAWLRSRNSGFLPCCLVSMTIFFYLSLKVWGGHWGLNP